uniref:Phage virion morphogenesis family protein n=1 Tax=Candidatus Kentrum sp. LFY TaxID=2126342 RepID=A0A450V4P5_9GAMM|nr:MAG: Phage virion morphogenesis family protein [Candidatus Kentron sp. LFY]
MQFTVDFETDHLDRALSALRKAVSSPDEMMSSIGESLQPINEDRHARGVSPDGEEWKELSEMTKKEKQGGRLLYQYGDMTRSFHYQAKGSELTLGFSDHKSVWHHFGTGSHGRRGQSYTITPKKAKALSFAGIMRKRVTHPGIPARPLIGFPETDRNLVVDVVEDHLMDILKRVRQGNK